MTELVGTDFAPPAPKHVRLSRADGSEIPVECVYEGQDKDGLHVWAAVLTFKPRMGDSLLTDEMPGRTSIRVAIDP